MEIQFTTRIFKEGRTYVAHAIELDVSSCGGSSEIALEHLKEAIRLFLKEAAKMGTQQQILQDAGYSTRNRRICKPKFVSLQSVTLPLPPAHAKSLVRSRA